MVLALSPQIHPKPKIIDLKEHYKPVQIETKIKNRIQHLIVEKEIPKDDFFASRVWYIMKMKVPSRI